MHHSYGYGPYMRLYGSRQYLMQVPWPAGVTAWSVYHLYGYRLLHEANAVAHQDPSYVL